LHLIVIAVLPAYTQNFFQVTFLPAMRIAARHNNGAGIFHSQVGLSEGGFTQFLFLLGIAHHDKTPRLQVITAGRLKAGANNFFQISRMICAPSQLY
jgi:hypothetical protein